MNRGVRSHYMSHAIGVYVKRRGLILCAAVLLLGGCISEPSSTVDALPNAEAASDRRGSASKPLRVLLVPADGGTSEGPIADFEPVFQAITREYDLHFDVKVAQSYVAVVEGMVSEKVDIAWFGPVTYYQAKQRGAAQLLAVGVTDGESVYYSGIFTRKQAGLEGISDLKGKSVAFGDVNSTSSFNFPVAMLIDAGLDPTTDLGTIWITDCHANSLAALAAGRVDAACASYTSFEKGVTNGQLDLEQIVPLAKSDPIPYPPMAMHVNLPDDLKSKLKLAFNNVHQAEGVTPAMIRGYGGKMIDRYNADYSEEEFDRAMAKLSAVTDDLKNQMIVKARER